MSRYKQPDNIFLTFENVNTLSGDNVLNYYYREGVVYMDGSENKPEPKRLALSPSQRSRTTEIKARDEFTGGGIYTTVEGVSFPYDGTDEIYVTHNYFGEQNIDRDVNSNEFRNSWWYDTKFHRSYKIYYVIGYTEVTDIDGTDYYDWRVKNAYIVYKDASQDASDGVFTFNAQPVANPNISASAVFGTPNNLQTWSSATLKLYLNNTVIESETVTFPDITGSRIDLITTLTASAISINDTLRLSMEVNGGSTVIDPLIVSEYSMSVDTPGGGSNFQSFLGLTTGLGLEDDPDCQPTLNNAVTPRLSQFVQDVDYSEGSNVSGSGILLPQNIDLIRNDQAARASTPDSNYSSKSRTIIRYEGSKTSRREINEYQDDEPRQNLGPIPNVELLNAYIGYFNRLVDPYPNLNRKTAFFVKYLVNDVSTVFDPSLTDINFSILENTFKLKAYDNEPTNCRISIQNISEAKELKNLEETLPEVFQVGKYPSPILFSQISAQANVAPATGFPMLGATNLTATGPWWSIDATDRKVLNCTSTVLINTYNDNYYMGELDYQPGQNEDYPLGREPEFTKFDPVTKPWTLITQSVATGSATQGDEFRFENNENHTFEVINVAYTASTSLTVTLDREIPTGVDPDFFLIRRYEKNPGFVILDVQKPYGIPVSQSSSPGILAPEYRVEKLENDPDTILADLIEKNLI